MIAAWSPSLPLAAKMGCAASDESKRCLLNGLGEEEAPEAGDDALQVCDTNGVAPSDRAKALQIDPKISIGGQLSTHMHNTTMMLDGLGAGDSDGFGGSGTWLGSKVSSVLLSKLATRMTRMSMVPRNSKEHMVTTVDPRDMQELRDEMLSCQLDESIAEMIAAASAALEKDESEGPLGAAERSPRRCARQKIRFIQTLGRIASARMQLIIENPRRIEECYELGQQIGKGGFGSVLKATVKATKATRAVKAMLKERVQANMDFLKKEIEITKMVDHPNIIKLYEIFEDEDTIYFVMELCSGGPLLDRVKQTKRLTEKQSAIVMLQIFRAVYYLHKNHITHRDLKSENCLLSTSQPIENNSIKVTDFGLSCYFQPGQMLTSRVGTPSYMAPEVYAKCYDEACDLWSCGVMMYSLLVGSLPFSSKDDKELRGKILAGKYRFRADAWCNISSPCIELIQNLLVVDTQMRFTAKEALNHEWIKTMAPLPDVALHQDLLQHLSSFRTQNKFKKAALHIVASLLREEQLSEYIKAWISVDVDGDGTLSPVELRERLRSTSLATLYDSVDEIFHDETGQSEDLIEYTYTEFLAATFDKRRYIAEDVCRAAFSVFDQNGDGTLSKEELRTGYMFGSLSPEELRRLVNDLDDNGDGEIDFHEFMQMMITGNTKRQPKPGEKLELGASSCKGDKLGRSTSFLKLDDQTAPKPGSESAPPPRDQEGRRAPSVKVVKASSPSKDSAPSVSKSAKPAAGGAQRTTNRGQPPSKDPAAAPPPPSAASSSDSPRQSKAGGGPGKSASTSAQKRASSGGRLAGGHGEGARASAGAAVGGGRARSASAAERAKKEGGASTTMGKSSPTTVPADSTIGAVAGKPVAKKQPPSATRAQATTEATSLTQQPPKSSKATTPAPANGKASASPGTTPRPVSATGSTPNEREKIAPASATVGPKGPPVAAVSAASTSVGGNVSHSTTRSRAVSSSPSPSARTSKT